MRKSTEDALRWFLKEKVQEEIYRIESRYATIARAESQNMDDFNRWKHLNVLLKGLTEKLDKN